MANLQKPISEMSVGEFLTILDPKLKESISSAVSEAIAPLKCQVQDNTENIQSLMEENSKLQKTIEAQAKMIEDQKRQNNLIIHGLADSNPTDTPTDTLRQFLEEKLSISVQPHEINFAKRIGAVREEKPRTMVASFTSLNTKISVLKNAHKLKGSNISISKDYNKITMETRKELLPLIHSLKQKGFDAKLRDADILIDNKKVTKEKAIALKKRSRAENDSSNTLLSSGRETKRIQKESDSAKKSPSLLFRSPSLQQYAYDK